VKKTIIFSIFIIILLSFYLLSDSYRYSFEAKGYYEMGDYEKAYKLAEKAYNLNRYNNMAFTILTQSKLAKVWETFINDSNHYFLEIESISNKDVITKKDKIRIKMMLEIIMGEYKNLPKSHLLNKQLRKRGEIQFNKAKRLYNGIFKKGT
jgi:tetratricopeptide (TPR) repeat protein